jgi:hypothetical protein
MQPSTGSNMPSPVILIMMLGLITLVLALTGSSPAPSPGSSPAAVVAAASALKTKSLAAKPVRVDLYVMSKCPDAARCFPVFAEVLNVVGDIVAIETDYITRGLDASGKLICPHGDGECMGDKQQLCARRQAEDTAMGRHQKDWYKFVACHTGDFTSIPDPKLVEKCAKEAGMDAEDIIKCASSKLGEELLLASAEKTKASGAKKSCTIHVSGKQRCIVDGGQWQDCDGGHEVKDFVATICEEYEKNGGDAGGVPNCPSRVGKHAGGH